MTETPTENLKILLVDDTPAILHVVISILDEYDTLIAKNGEQGLEAAKNLKPDMILLDVMMPGMSGFDVLKELKADEETKSIHVILVSGKESNENEAKGYSLGATDYIQKPFDESIIKHKVKFIMEYITMKRELES